jgi:hypothetical protein
MLKMIQLIQLDNNTVVPGGGNMSMPPPAQFRSQSEMIEYLSALEGRISELEGQNQRQLAVIEDLRNTPPAVPADHGLPKTNLFHFNFLKRAFTVWGHWFVAQFVLGLIIAIIYMVVLLVLFAAGNFIFVQ